MLEFAKQQQLCLFPMCFCVSATQASSHVHMSRTNCSQRERCPVALLFRLRQRLQLRFSGRLRCSLAIIIINSDAAAAAKISAICPACLRHKNMPGPAFSCGSSTPSYSSRFPIFPIFPLLMPSYSSCSCSFCCCSFSNLQHLKVMCRRPASAVSAGRRPVYGTRVLQFLASFSGCPDRV